MSEEFVDERELVWRKLQLSSKNKKVWIWDFLSRSDCLGGFLEKSITNNQRRYVTKLSQSGKHIKSQSRLPYVLDSKRKTNSLKLIEFQ